MTAGMCTTTRSSIHACPSRLTSPSARSYSVHRNVPRMEYRDETHSESIGNKRSQSEEHKICVVCGDKALGYNFNAITCESCKAFFRRNALKTKPLVCRNFGNCTITVSSRRYCQKCRLKKCIEAGMLVDLITVRPDDKEGSSNHSGSVKKRQSTDSDVSTTKFFAASSSTVPCTFPYPYPYTAQCPSQGSASTMELVSSTPPDHDDYNLPSLSNTTDRKPYEDEIAQLQEKLDTSHDSDDPLIPISRTVLMHLVNLCHGNIQHESETDLKTVLPSSGPPKTACVCRCVCVIGHGERERGIEGDSGTEEGKSRSVESETVQDGLEEMDHHPKLERRPKRRPINWTSQALKTIEPALEMVKVSSDNLVALLPPDSPVIELPPELDSVHLFKLEELLSANEIMATSRQISGPPISYADSGLAADMMDLAIRRTLEMMKCVDAFCSLSPMDQAGLFKGAIRELMCLRGLMVYELSVNSFRPVGYPYRYLRLDAMRRNPDGHIALQKYYKSFHSSWTKCDPLMLCLSSVVTFDPSRSGIVDVGAIQRQREFYQNLLLRYLMTIYTPKEAERIYRRLFRLLEIMRDNVDYFCPAIHLEMDTAPVEVMLVSILPP